MEAASSMSAGIHRFESITMWCCACGALIRAALVRCAVAGPSELIGITCGGGATLPGNPGTNCLGQLRLIAADVRDPTGPRCATIKSGFDARK